MFNVGRYDPGSAKKKKTTSSSSNSKKRPRPSASDGNSTPSHPPSKTSLSRVIAPDESNSKHTNKQPRDFEKDPVWTEAVDDLDLWFVDGDAVQEDDNDNMEDAAEEQAEAEAQAETTDQATNELQSALRWSKKPLSEAAVAWKLAPFLKEQLEQRFEHFFPVQAWSIQQVLWQISSLGQQQEPDVCITAPTGSGKTLAYGLPILHALSSTTATITNSPSTPGHTPRPRTRRLRALVVLPSRDLAQQVHQVFQEFCTPQSNLKVGLAIGQSHFKAEQVALTVDEDRMDDRDMMRHRLRFDPGNLELALELYRHPYVEKDVSTQCWSNVDILVSTPGRLVDHMDRTPGFSLRNLDFLVVDEADRLLNQRYHNWLNRVFAAVDHPSRLRKFLVSATMTRDPRKLASLRLINPKHFDGHKNTLHIGKKESDKLYSMPDTLQEYSIECTAEQKPLVLLALLLEIFPSDKATALRQQQSNLVIVFTSSVDSTHRLTRLLQLLWKAAERPVQAIVELSSATKGHERSRLLKECSTGSTVRVLVCSDAMSRGMDIQNVGTVIHYDVPSLAKTYVHRCGRTARAGQSGSAIVLLKGRGQAGQFWNLRSKLVRGADRVIKNRPLQTDLVRDVPYRECLATLKDVLQAEDDGELRVTDPLTDDY